MKALRTVLTHLLLIAIVCCGLTANSQTNSPTDAELKRVLIAAEQNKINLQKIDVLHQQISDLNKRIEVHQNIINELRGKEGNYKEIIAVHEEQKKIMQEQRVVFEKEILRLNKELKKQKRRTLWTAIGGVVGIVATATLFVIAK